MVLIFKYTYHLNFTSTDQGLQGLDLRNAFEVEADSAEVVPDYQIWGPKFSVPDLNNGVDENVLLDSALLDVIEKGVVTFDNVHAKLIVNYRPRHEPV
jgi:hypothetical protein